MEGIPGSETVRRNLAHLEASGEVGQLLIPFYEEALVQAPQLAQVVVRSMSADKTYFGYTLPPHLSDSGAPEVVIDTETGWDFYADYISSRPTAVAITAESLGLPVEEVNEELIAVFIFLHELGRAKHWIDNGYDEAALERIRHQDIDSLPVRGISPGRLIKSIAFKRAEYEEVLKRNKNYLKKHGITDLETMVEVQERAYRQLITEIAADQFAVKIMLTLGE